MDKSSTKGQSRRFFLQASAAVAVFSHLPQSMLAFGKKVQRAFVPAKRTHSLTCTINGKEVEIQHDTRTTLLDLLREQLQLTGTKKGCDHGQCGACTVHINGKRQLSCLTLAATLQQKNITTIEGIGTAEQLHPMQQAFLSCDGFQCGYCTPGQIMSAISCVQEGKTKSVEEIKEFMSGNLCRCGAYNGIVQSIQKVAEQSTI